jgi:hypothetical protein
MKEASKGNENEEAGERAGQQFGTGRNNGHEVGAQKDREMRVEKMNLNPEYVPHTSRVWVGWILLTGAW